MNRLLLDTNFIIALLDSKDHYHKKALEIESRIKEKEVKLSYYPITHLLKTGPAST